MKHLFLAATAVALTANPILAESPRLASQVDGLAIETVSELPENTLGTPDATFCPIISTGPASDAGRAVADKGWGVTGEVGRGDLTVVSFVASGEQGTSGSCLLGDGNIGVFRGTELQALVYAVEGAARGIGSIEEAGPDRLRIWDGDWLAMPLADLQLHKDGPILVRHVADRDSLCGGAASVQNIYGLPIHIARLLLLEDGWQPAPRPEGEDAAFTGFRDALAQAGIPEVQDCSGTGFGYCMYSYDGPGGARLSVSTAGEGAEGSTPAVSGYSVDCGGAG